MTEEVIQISELDSANTAKEEILTITEDLDEFIVKNSSRSLEFMKFEMLERLGLFIAQHNSLINTAAKLEEDFKNDPRINAIQLEVEWYQKRVEDFVKIKDYDLEILNQYKNTVSQWNKEKTVLEQELKTCKGKVLKLQASTPRPNQLSPIKYTSSKNISPRAQISSLSAPEQEQYEYLLQASIRVKKTLDNVKNEVQRYKSQEYQTRQQVLPLEEFFTDCYKSVYQFLFQRQSQLDDYQLSLAYKMFRNKKMEYSDIKHRSHSSSRSEKYVLRDALTNRKKADIKEKKKQTGIDHIKWEDFKKLPVETVFILISRADILKALRRSLCSVDVKFFITSESKTSVDQFEEFRKEYLDRLKIRTDEKGSAINIHNE